jgi:hypothetical protein
LNDLQVFIFGCWVLRLLVVGAFKTWTLVKGVGHWTGLSSFLAGILVSSPTGECLQRNEPDPELSSGFLSPHVLSASLTLSLYNASLYSLKPEVNPWCCPILSVWPPKLWCFPCFLKPHTCSITIGTK